MKGGREGGKGCPLHADMGMTDRLTQGGDRRRDDPQGCGLVLRPHFPGGSRWEHL